MRIYICSVSVIVFLIVAGHGLAAENGTLGSNGAGVNGAVVNGAGQHTRSLENTLQTDLSANPKAPFSSGQLYKVNEEFIKTRAAKLPFNEKLTFLFGNAIHDRATIFELDELLYFFQMSDAEYRAAFDILHMLLRQDDLKECSELVLHLSLPERHGAIAVLGAFYAKNLHEGSAVAPEEDKKVEAVLVMLSGGGAYLLDYLYTQESVMGYLQASAVAKGTDEAYIMKEAANVEWKEFEQRYAFTNELAFSAYLIKSQTQLRDTWRKALLDKRLAPYMGGLIAGKTSQEFVFDFASLALDILHIPLPVEIDAKMDAVAIYKKDRLYLNPTKMVDDRTGGVMVRILLSGIVHEAAHYVQKQIYDGTMKVDAALRQEVDNFYKLYMHPRIITRDFEMLYFLQPLEVHANYMAALVSFVLSQQHIKQERRLTR